MDEVRGVRGEEDGCTLEVFGLAVAAGGDTDEQGVAALDVLANRARKLGREVARGYGVHVDP